MSTFRDTHLGRQPMTDNRHTDVELLASRGRWFDVRVRVQPHPRRAGWDIVLRIDGTYTDLADAERIAKFWREQITGGE